MVIWRDIITKQPSIYVIWIAFYIASIKIVTILLSSTEDNKKIVVLLGTVTQLFNKKR